MVGQLVGKYRVVDRIGRGGMGTVYRAVDETLHREVAIKVLNAELNDPEIAKRFRAEAITVARLSHPGIATIYELFEHENEWLMVMEFVRGETLEAMATRMGPLSAQRASELCMQALAALAHAHSMGVVHRDLKPANLMITENGSVKVMDFGIARVSGSEHLTNAGFMMGTPAYMAPEQIRGGDIDARADLYAMGVVFYRLTTGRLPFKGDSAYAMVQSQVNELPTPVATIRTDLPSWVEEIVARALAKPVEGRFQSAAEFHEALARCLAGIPLSSMYAPPDQATMITPPRPMPSGAYPTRAMPTPSATYPMPTPTGQSVLASSGANTFPPPSAPAPAQRSQATQIRKAPSKKGLPVMWLGAGGAALIAGVIGTMMFTGGSTPPPAAPTPTPTPTETSAPVVDPAASGTASGSPTPTATPDAGAGTATATPAGVAPVSTAARGATPPATPTAGAGRAGTPAPTTSPTLTPTPTPTPTAAAATPTPAPTSGTRAVGAEGDTPATFGDVKFYEISGKRATDRDAILNFGGGMLTVAPRTGGAAIAAISYKRITRATYARGRDPKWDEKLLSPPAGVEFGSRLGSIIRSNYHWLVLQGTDHVEILRLEDVNFSRILDALEARTGTKVIR